MHNSVMSRLFFVVTLVSIALFNPGLNVNAAKQQPEAISANPILGQQSRGRIFLPMVSTPRAYYVATNGNDANPGTLSAPWRTIGKAARTLGPSDNVMVRGGVYNEQINLTKSGTASGQIVFQAYPNETPVIEGAGMTMSSWAALVSISGSYIQFSGFEVRNSSYIGVIIKGSHVTVDNVYAHHNRENGILIAGDYGTVQNSRVWRNVLSNEYAKLGSNSTGLSAAREASNGVTDYAVMRNNQVWENWGEGLSSFEANQVTIEGNVVHDNLTANIYISDSTNILCQNNLVYMDPASYVYGKASNVGIMLGDERYQPASANIKVINNIAVGNHRNFFWWQGSKGGGMNNVLIAHNTFVNGSGDGSNGNSNVIITPGAHQNVVFENNIVQQDSAIYVIGTVKQAGVIFQNNLWSKAPGAAAGPGDIVGDPRLSHSGAQFSAQWFSLSGNSPAVNRAVKLGEVPLDFARYTRDGQPDIGAMEYHP